MIKISTSILSSDDRIECIKKLNNTNINYIHIDAMDGIFVKNKNLEPDEVNELNKHSNLPLDIHLMVNNPEEYINHLNIYNINNITFHIEINKNIENIINKIKNLGVKVGLAINPNTDINLIKNYINKIDIILIMSVEPGYGGQKFIPRTIERIKEIRNLKKDIIIEVDGGINNINIKEIEQYINIAVVGSYITKNNNYNEAINNLKN